MNTHEQELTGSTHSGYDRYMSEGATGVLESETTELLDTQLLSKWEPYIKDADANLRDAIIRKIKDKKEPDADLSLNRGKLNEMAQEEVDRRFKEMTSQPEVRRPDDLFKVDAILKNYMTLTENAYKEIGDDSVAAGEVLWKVDSWEKYGWRDETAGFKGDKAIVIENIMEVFEGLEINNDKGKKTAEKITEIFLSKGLKPEDLTKEKLEEKIRLAVELIPKGAKRDDPAHEHIHFTAGDVEAAKSDPEIIALRLLGIEQNQIAHHILQDEYKRENDHELYYSLSGPQNIEELAWQIMHTTGTGYDWWGVHGETPLLEMRIEVKRDPKTGEPISENGQEVVDTEKSGYRVNTANVVRWARNKMYSSYDRDREDPHNFFEVISLDGRSGTSFNQMLLTPKQYFTSEDGTSYGGLALELYKEAATFTTVRAWDVAYRGVAGDPTELAKVFKEMYNTKNLMTRGALGSNIMGLMTTMPFEYQGTTDGKWKSDNIMGAAWIDIYRCYDAMSDYEGLKNVLGVGSKFFTQKGWAEAIREVAKENKEVTGVSNFKVFFDMETNRWFEGAFDENGEISTIENRRNFIKFLNIFSLKMPSSKLEFTVRAALRGAIAEKYGQEAYIKYKDKITGKRECLRDEHGNKIKQHAFITSESGKKSDDINDRVADTDSLKVAEAIAWSLARPFGACAKNDPDAIGHDWMARVYQTQLMRQKYPHRGDKFGEKNNMMAIKRTGIDILNGTLTEGPMPLYDEEGKPRLDKHGVPMYRKRTPMEIFSELAAFKTVAMKKQRLMEKELEAINPKDKEAIAKQKKKIKEQDDWSNQRYQDIAQNVSFSQRTLSNYWEDHLHYGMELYTQLVDSKEIPFEKFTSYDVFGGVRFNGEEFAKEVQSTWIHKIRYMIETYPSINLNQKVRVMNQTETNKRHWGKDHRLTEPVYHEVTLGEAMFGHEMLNIPKFWKREKKKNGKDGKPIPLRDKNGRKIKGMYEIDYQKVQENKQAVWKQWFMMKVAGDLAAHKKLHGNEPRRNFTYYQNVVEALGRIPEDIDQDEYSFKDQVINKYFFDKANIAWLRKKAGVTSFQLYAGAFVKDIFMDDKPEEGFGLVAALGIAMKSIIRDKI